MSLIFVDCEAYGGCPGTGRLTEFGAVEFKSRETFHGIVLITSPQPSNPAVPMPIDDLTDSVYYSEKAMPVFDAFARWLVRFGKGRHVMVSDNPAFDFQWINDGFLRTYGMNPFGHSARRISDFYAGLVGDFYETQHWKYLRQTPHDHNPVNDAMGNVEAFERLLKGER